MIGAIFNDFEVNPRGYSEEIRLSRDLVNKLLIHHQYNELHEDVRVAISKLMALYERQKEEGIM